MDLLLVRHGLAGKADPSVWPDDDLRPLTAKGRKAFKAAALLAKALGLGARALKDWDALHHASAPERALSLLPRQRLPKVAALVGHEPWLGEFLSLLICGKTDAGFRLGKGGAAWVEIPASGKAQGRGRLHWLLTQDQLAALG